MLKTKAREGRGPAHAAWARMVKERDGYRCVSCGRVGRPVNPRGPRVEAHHKRPWSSFPELRYDLDNGETLCVEGRGNCHRRMHPGMRRTRRHGLWKLIGGFLAFWSVWFWFAPESVAMRPTRAMLAYAVLVLVVRFVRRRR